MTLDLLNQIIPAGFDYSYLFIILAGLSILLIILVVVQMLQISKLKKKYKKFMSGKDAYNMEERIIRLFEDNKYLVNISENNKKDIRAIRKEMEYAFNKVGIIRYDAFQQMGGKLSFSVALLNHLNDGFILNSVHSAEGCYTYIKEIEKGVCKIELSNEEKAALAKAMKE